MRVLIALLATAAGACYAPDVEDCQFRCGSGDACPAGTSCMGGFCRGEATGVCAAADACLTAPSPPAGCGPKAALDGATACAAICPGPRSWLEARMDCAAAGWQLGILDSPGKLASVPQALGPRWIGARRASSSSPWLWIDGTPIANEAWSNGTAPGNGSGDDCAVLGGASRTLSNNVDCGDPERFLCTYAP